MGMATKKGCEQPFSGKLAEARTSVEGGAVPLVDVFVKG